MNSRLVSIPKYTTLSIFFFLILAVSGWYVLARLQSLTQIAHHAPRIKLKNGTSTNWAGYAALTDLTHPQSYSVTDVKGSWQVPALSCSSGNTYSSAWVGIDGYSDGTVEQLGTEHDCSGSQTTYYSWYEMYPKFGYKTPLSVHPGDIIAAEVKYDNNSRYTLSMKNMTAGGSFSTTQKASRPLRQSAEWIIEAPSSSSGVLPLADFNAIHFSTAEATINGQSGSINNAAWKNDAITMTSDTNVLKASPSALTTDGSSFDVTWYSQ